MVSGWGNLDLNGVFCRTLSKKRTKKGNQKWNSLISVNFADRISVSVAVVCLFVGRVEFFHFMAVERRASGNEAESHETLAQRIEKDVVGFNAQTCLCNPHNCSVRLLTIPLRSPPSFVLPSKSSTAPSTTSRSLCRGCKRQRRPSLSSTVATRVRRARRKDQQVCPPFFSCRGTSARQYANVLLALKWFVVFCSTECVGVVLQIFAGLLLLMLIISHLFQVYCYSLSFHESLMNQDVWTRNTT